MHLKENWFIVEEGSYISRRRPVILFQINEFSCKSVPYFKQQIKIRQREITCLKNKNKNVQDFVSLIVSKTVRKL